MVRFFAAMLGIVLAACAAQQPVPPLDLSSTPTDIAAQYITRHVAVDAAENHAHHDDEHHEGGSVATVNWRFFRTANRIDVDNLSANTGETWQRDGKVVIMRKLFHDDRKAIEYQMDDFAVLKMKPSWRKQALLLDDSLLSQLKLEDERWIDGHPARIYRGTLAGQQIEITWLVDFNLPQSIVRHDHEGNLIEQTTLAELHSPGDTRWRCRCGDGYDVIDYADLGDRERDQFVMRVQSQLPGGNVHRH
jgi:hypothetical protein